VNSIEFDGHDPAEGTYKNAPDSDWQVQTYGRRSLSREAADERRRRRSRQASAPSEQTQDFLRAPDRAVSDWAAQNLTARKAKREYRIKRGLEPKVPEGTRFGERVALGRGGAVDSAPEMTMPGTIGGEYTAAETMIASCLVTLPWCVPRAAGTGVAFGLRAGFNWVRGQLTRRAAPEVAEQTAPRITANGRRARSFQKGDLGFSVKPMRRGTSPSVAVSADATSRRPSDTRRCIPSSHQSEGRLSERGSACGRASATAARWFGTPRRRSPRAMRRGACAAAFVIRLEVTSRVKAWPARPRAGRRRLPPVRRCGMRDVLRRLRLAPQLKVSMERAEEIARAEAESRGWPWEEPVHRSTTLRGYCFRTNANKRGGNVEVVVRADTGEVTRAWFGPR
jgi:hypothetical protein